MCPFCRREEPTTAAHGIGCGGSFLDKDHPSTVRMLLVEIGDDGAPLAEHEQRLREARASYRRGGA